MPSSKSYIDLTDAEIARLSKLTPAEQQAIDALLAAAKALPKSLFIDVDDDPDGHLTVSKRITKGSGQQVAKLRKASLCF